MIEYVRLTIFHSGYAELNVKEHKKPSFDASNLT